MNFRQPQGAFAPCRTETEAGDGRMDWLVAIGAAISLIGIAGLIWCVLLALNARKSAPSEDIMRARLQKVVLLNMGALGVSALGLMIVVTGILLG